MGEALTSKQQEGQYSWSRVSKGSGKRCDEKGDGEGSQAARRWSRKTLSSPPLVGTPKLQLFTEHLLMLLGKIGSYKKRPSTT